MCSNNCSEHSFRPPDFMHFEMLISFRYRWQYTLVATDILTSHNCVKNIPAKSMLWTRTFMINNFVLLHILASKTFLQSRWFRLKLSRSKILYFLGTCFVTHWYCRTLDNSILQQAVFSRLLVSDFKAFAFSGESSSCTNSHRDISTPQ